MVWRCQRTDLKILRNCSLIGNPMTDEDGKKFIMTPMLIDQIAYRTEKYQMDELVNILGYYNDFNGNESQETYSRFYDMLTSVMNAPGQSNWFFVRNLYMSVQDGAQIVEEMEIMIKQHIWGK